MVSNKRQRGIVAKWLNHNGVGFITPEGQDTKIGQDYLVHHRNIKQAYSFKSLAEGTVVEFDTMEDPKHPNKLMATNVTGIGGSFLSSGDDNQFTNRAKVFVGKLPPDCDWRDLKDYFSQCGFVKSAHVFKSKSGMGTVQFRKAEEASIAIKMLNRSELWGSIIEVWADKKAR